MPAGRGRPGSGAEPAHRHRLLRRVPGQPRLAARPLGRGGRWIRQPRHPLRNRGGAAVPAAPGRPAGRRPPGRLSGRGGCALPGRRRRDRHAGALHAGRDRGRSQRAAPLRRGRRYRLHPLRALGSAYRPLPRTDRLADPRWAGCGHGPTVTLSAHRGRERRGAGGATGDPGRAHRPDPRRATMPPCDRPPATRTPGAGTPWASIRPSPVMHGP